ncbi:MAG: DUF1634 domain-containing protein [Betaproteobacteria bacterium]
MTRKSDSALEVLIGRVLRIGVVISTVLLGVGLVLSLLHLGGASVLLNAGIIVLVSTPAARVVLSFVEYLLGRDWAFAVLTGIVLIELIASAVAAIVFHRRI